ncbi:MAG TPA: RDD family protein, partial [Arthrobacter sp.]|nr:RDD family protein [Arthrobacter sp.]
MSSIVTGEAVVLELRPASFAARGLGTAIDMAMQAMLAVVFLFVLGSVPGLLDSAAAAVLVLLGLVFLFVIVPVGVET